MPFNLNILMFDFLLLYFYFASFYYDVCDVDE